MNADSDRFWSTLTISLRKLPRRRRRTTYLRFATPTNTPTPQHTQQRNSILYSTRAPLRYRSCDNDLTFTLLYPFLGTTSICICIYPLFRYHCERGMELGWSLDGYLISSHYVSWWVSIISKNLLGIYNEARGGGRRERCNAASASTVVDFE